jgi:ribosomal protein S18 acetylase RimI-like enzyme
VRIVLKDAISSAESDAMIAPLVAHNTAQGVDFTSSPFALELEDDGGNIVGGVTGHSRWGWLYLATVAVSAELRGQGWGRQLIEAAEAVAVQRGCQYVWLDTYSFQARPFYEKLGYRVFGQLPDHPPGHTRFFMFKTLRNDAV